jgi:hypothetical protein
MKRCGYCGRDNQDEATVCRECGTNEFVASVPLTPKDAPPENVETAAHAPLEQPRSRDPENAGAGDEAQLVVSAPRNLDAAARAAIESTYLNSKLPENHYLLTSTDEELVEIVAQSSKWSAFDVAHARRLISERGIDLKKVEDKRAEHLRQLRQGQPASKKLIVVGWLFSILGGLVGIGIAWSLSYMKEKTPHGEFFTYDEKSREVGKKNVKGGSGSACSRRSSAACAAFAGALALIVNRPRSPR